MKMGGKLRPAWYYKGMFTPVIAADGVTFPLDFDPGAMDRGFLLPFGTGVPVQEVIPTYNLDTLCYEGLRYLLLGAGARALIPEQELQDKECLSLADVCQVSENKVVVKPGDFMVVRVHNPKTRQTLHTILQVVDDKTFQSTPQTVRFDVQAVGSDHSLKARTLSVGPNIMTWVLHNIRGATKHD